MPDVTITARQPLALGTRPQAGAPAPTHRHIPGSVLRGALAAAWIVEHGEPTDSPELRAAFVDLFERGVRFGPLFADGSTVVPLSVLRCKYKPDDACAEAWVDEAFDETSTHCPRCRGPLTRGRGMVGFLGNAGQGLVTRTTRVALTAEGTAKDNALHTRDALGYRDNTGTPRRFTGRIVGGGEWLLGQRRLLLGGRRSTSGAADYHATSDPPATLPEPPGRRLVVRLLSPAILVDRAGRPTDRPDEDLLTRLLDVPVRVERQWTRRERVGGWHAAADLPKPDERVVTAGSVYELQLGDDPDPQTLQHLLDHGLGLRRTEGFGWISIDPWQPPPRPATSADTEPDRVAEGMSTMLAGLGGGLGRWFVGELKQYLAHLNAGGAPHTELLQRRRLERLSSQQHELLRTLLEQGDPARIRAVVDGLEARIRGVVE